MKDKILNISIFDFLIATELYIQGLVFFTEYYLKWDMLITPSPGFTDSLLVILLLQSSMVFLLSLIPVLIVGIGFSSIKDSIKGDRELYYLSFPFYFPIYCISWFIEYIKFCISFLKIKLF